MRSACPIPLALLRNQDRASPPHELDQTLPAACTCPAGPQIPLGAAADRIGGARLLTACLFLWSLANALFCRTPAARHPFVFMLVSVPSSGWDRAAAAAAGRAFCAIQQWGRIHAHVLLPSGPYTTSAGGGQAQLGMRRPLGQVPDQQASSKS